MDELAARLLAALVEGYRARAGMKERNQALTEYEIARRAGLTEASYAEFSDTAEREQVRDVLGELERLGLVSLWPRAGRYDACQPTVLALQRVAVSPVAESLLTTADPADTAAAPPVRAAAPADASLATIARQLDEIVLLLRAIDAKLERAI